MERLSILVMMVVAACGGSSAGVGTPDAGRPPVDASTPDAGCVPGGVCTGNPGAPCLLGRVTCATGTATCVDGVPGPDGTSCGGGTCAGGLCLNPTTISTDVNLTTDTLTSGRTCAEAPQFVVTALAPSSATLAAAPAGDCLVAGDEVLLINLQGTPAAVDNVGNWELLGVGSVAGASVTFTSPKTRSYGAVVGSDSGIGTGAGDQKVALIRVPRFGALTVAAGATVTAAAWDGAAGGVVALRAGSLTIDGTISAKTIGYRDGRWSRDSARCADNVTTETGESISGPAIATTARNTGGPGGIGAATGIRFVDDNPLNASAGHATAGEAGINPNGRTLGDPGTAYGVGDGSRLTMGSGASGNITCEINFPGPALFPFVPVPTGGGIVFVIGGDISLGATGGITATAEDMSRDVAAAGGYVFLQGHNLALGAGQVTARGAVAHGGSAATIGMSNQASPGYIALRATGTITGTTDPAAMVVTP